MKRILKLVFFYLLLLQNSISFSQSNNPYNQRGIDYMASLSIITNDIRNHTVSDINQTTIDRYSSLIPLQTQASTEMASTIIRTVKSPGFTLSGFIDNSSLSSDAKQSFRDAFLITGERSWNEYQSDLVSKVNAIKNGRLPTDEKELLLSLIAVTYNASPALQGRSGEAICTAFGAEGSGPIPCWVAGAAVGAVVGFRICGVWCALGGAVIGGVVGSMS
jgi:hypothetical protein